MEAIEYIKLDRFIEQTVYEIDQEATSMKQKINAVLPLITDVDVLGEVDGYVESVQVSIEIPKFDIGDDGEPVELAGMGIVDTITYDVQSDEDFNEYDIAQWLLDNEYYREALEDYFSMAYANPDRPFTIHVELALQAALDFYKKSGYTVGVIVMDKQFSVVTGKKEQNGERFIQCDLDDLAFNICAAIRKVVENGYQ